MSTFFCNEFAGDRCLSPANSLKERISQHLWIKNIGWSLILIVGNKVVTCHSGHQRACFQRGTADVWQEYNVLHSQQFRLNGWLVLEDVQSCTRNNAILQGFHQSFFIHNWPTRCINQNGGGL